MTTTAQNKAKKRQEQLKKMQESIAEQVATFTDSTEWKRFLDFAQKFHAYSFHNVMMILAQCPHATRVAGYRKWSNELGRQVRKGEKAIKILGYSTKKIITEDENGEEVEQRRVIYPILSVFDISQTDPIDGVEPEPTIAHALTATDDADIYGRAKAFAESHGYTVTREPIPGSANGFIRADGTFTIVVKDTLSDAHAAKTLLHECAHMLLHVDNGHLITDDDKPRSVHEIEAESVAYIVAGILGLDTSQYSIGYVASWSSGDIDLIRSTAERVLTTAHTLADALEPTTDNHTQAA